MELEKDKKIKSEIKRLNTILKDLDKNTIKGVKSLIENAAFMSVTLSELQDTINKEGPVCEYKNGENQFGYKRSISADLYQVTIKNYSAIIKQLNDILPSTGLEEEDDFDRFLNNR